ncbi:hypothetical protein L2E82_39574 [Cichorium intybus]|uniref:Uncharacterized protein n=1 Tax=Cichorium intybus TaxID=13427 RepID=A0ACB9AHX4_CICIN|nr:hypothetical protein L2E82_39574 [Cichorium intybus]
MPLESSMSDHEPDDSDTEFVEVDPSGRYGREADKGKAVSQFGLKMLVEVGFGALPFLYGSVGMVTGLHRDKIDDILIPSPRAGKFGVLQHVEDVSYMKWLLAEDGKNMSKRSKNYPFPKEIIHDYGAHNQEASGTKGCWNIIDWSDGKECVAVQPRVSESRQMERGAEA